MNRIVTGRRTITVVVVISLIALTVGSGAVAGQADEEAESTVQEHTQIIETGEEIEAEAVDEDSTQTIEEEQTEAEMEVEITGSDDDASGDEVDGLVDLNFVDDLFDESFPLGGGLFE